MKMFIDDEEELELLGGRSNRRRKFEVDLAPGKRKIEFKYLWRRTLKGEEIFNVGRTVILLPLQVNVNQ